MKYCHKCQTYHEIEAFPLNEYGRPSSPCKAYRNARIRAWRRENQTYALYYSRYYRRIAKCNRD